MRHLKGKVIKSTGSWYKVLAEDEQIYDCRIKGKFRLEGSKSTNPIAVGDQVVFVVDHSLEYAVIEKIEDRKNYLVRKSPNLSRQTHVLAANIDHTYLVASLSNPKVSSAFIDRFLVISEAYEIEPVIIFNKIDLYSDDELDTLAYYEDLYKDLGYNVFILSALFDQDIVDFIEFTKHKTVLFIGKSGVGKSTIINRLDPNLDLKVSEISNYHKKGKHTTTFYEMHPIGDNTFIIDSPGIKELGLHDFQTYEISLFFREMKVFSGKCKYSNCLHISEPGCAIKEALEQGMITEERYVNYLKILDDFDV